MADRLVGAAQTYSSRQLAATAASVGDNIVCDAGYDGGPVNNPNKRLTYTTPGNHDGTVNAAGAGVVGSHTAGNAFNFQSSGNQGSIVENTRAIFTLTGGGNFVLAWYTCTVRNCIFDVSNITFQSSSSVGAMLEARFRTGHKFYNNIQYGTRAGGSPGAGYLVMTADQSFGSVDLVANSAWLNAGATGAGVLVRTGTTLGRIHNVMVMGAAGVAFAVVQGTGVITTASHNTTSAGSIVGTNGVTGAIAANYVTNPASDHTPLASSPANGTGFDLSADYTTDAIGAAWSPWGRGAIAYVAAGGGTIPPALFMNHRRAG